MRRVSQAGRRSATDRLRPSTVVLTLTVIGGSALAGGLLVLAGLLIIDVIGGLR